MWDLGQGWQNVWGLSAINVRNFKIEIAKVSVVLLGSGKMLWSWGQFWVIF